MAIRLIDYFNVDKFQRNYWCFKKCEQSISIDGGYSIFDDQKKEYIFVNDLTLFTNEQCNAAQKNLADFDEECYDDYMNEIQDFLLEFEKVNDFSLTFRKKIITTILNETIGKSQIINKYEVKIKYCYENNFALIAYGVSGTLEKLMQVWDYKKIILRQNHVFNYPVYPIKYAGHSIVLMNNTTVGFLCHEAIGHMAEADLVLKGTAFSELLGKKIFDKSITIVDDGNTEYGAGNIYFDNEGTISSENIIIKEGVLNSFLTDTATAKYFGVKNTGNARKAFWNQPPHIRMTNTYLKNGNKNVEELLSQIEKGLYINEVVSGNCELNGEFELLASNVMLIYKGAIVGRAANVRVYDNVFTVFNNFYEIGNDSKLCLGAASCGKMASIKVDAGGPHVLTECYVEIYNER